MKWPSQSVRDTEVVTLKASWCYGIQNGEAVVEFSHKRYSLMSLWNRIVHGNLRRT